MPHKKLISYLEKNVPNFKINRRSHVEMFTCPHCNTPEVCRFVPGTAKINCMKCGYNDDIVGIAKLLGDISHTDTDETIQDRLDIDYGIDDSKGNKAILDFYEANHFDLVPIRKFDKAPFELQNWTTTPHKQRFEWEEWLKAGLNIGIKCGPMSGITVVDVDQEVIPPDIDLMKGSPLIQKTGRGWHLFYKWVDLPTSSIPEYKIDLLNAGRQVVAYPSKVYKKGTTELEIARTYVTPLVLTDMPPDLYKFLASKLKVNAIEKVVDDVDAVTFDENAKIDLISEGGRSNALMHLGGILSKELNASQTEFALNLLNKKLCNPPLSGQDLTNVTRMIKRYNNRDEKTLAGQVYKYLHIVEFANSREIKDALGFAKEDIDRALAFLVKEQRIIRKGRNFIIIKKADWKTTLNITANSLDFELPFFSRYANLCYCDNVLLGSGTKNGKTTIAMNLVKSISDQIKSKGLNRKLYYITSEAGSRFMKTAAHLGLNEGDFEWDFISDPTKIELEPDSITILDWLMIEDKAATDSVMKYFVDQLFKTNGFLVTFMQLKENGDWFAPNMVKQFPALASRYIYDDQTGVKGKWILDAIREPKTHVKTGIIPCEYVFAKRTLVELTQ